MSKADVSDAFRNLRVDPHQAHNCCYHIKRDLVAIDFPTDVRMVGIAGFLGCQVGCGRARALQHRSQVDPATRERKSHDGPREGGRSMGRRYTRVDSAGRQNQSAQRGRDIIPIFHTRVRRRLPHLIRVQHSDDDSTALIASASLFLRSRAFIWAGGGGSNPHLIPDKDLRTGNPRLACYGFTINSHTMRISFPREKADVI